MLRDAIPRFVFRLRRLKDEKSISRVFITLDLYHKSTGLANYRNLYRFSIFELILIDKKLTRIANYIVVTWKRFLLLRFNATKKFHQLELTTNR